MESIEHPELATVTLLASGARTVSGAGVDVVSGDIQKSRAVRFILTVTAHAGTTPTLDVEVQAKIGGLYTRLATFAQRTVTDTTTAREAKKTVSAAPIEYTLAADPALTAAGVSDIEWSDTFRVKYTIGGTTPSFTFSVTAVPVL